MKVFRTKMNNIYLAIVGAENAQNNTNEIRHMVYGNTWIPLDM